ncbi:hypothetical protein CR513_31896, partial [Mucuna pruriens]
MGLDVHMGMHKVHGEEHEKDNEHMEVKALKGLMTRGRLKRLEKEKSNIVISFWCSLAIV